MKRYLILVSFLFATIALASAGDRFITNTNQDKDVIIQVNKGGVVTDAMKIAGSTSNVDIGPAVGSFTAINTVNDAAGVSILNQNGGGGTKLTITNTENTGVYFDVNDGGTNAATAGATARSLFFRQGTIVGEVGSVVSGAWTLGPASANGSPSTMTHRFYGNLAFGGGIVNYGQGTPGGGGGTCSAQCQTEPAALNQNSGICIAAWTSSGAASTCGTTLVSGPCSCQGLL